MSPKCRRGSIDNGEGRAEVTGVDGVGGPCALEGGFFVHNYFGSGGRHWSGVKIVGSIEEGVG